LRSRSAFSWLLAKEWRELVASRAWWIMLALVGPFVGLSFISSVRTYSELSAGSGGAGGADVFSVLDGIWAPTFSAYELVAMFLLPFVAIRVVSGDRQSGALKLELQQRMSPFTRVLAKALVLLAGWLISGGAAIAAIGLWKLYGGATYAPEILVIAAGHVINAGLTVAFAAAAASIAENASTAAILTLSFTVGTWVLQFLAAVQGGVWEQLAGYTPMAVVASFQHGLLPLDTVLVSAILIVAGLAIAATWIQLGVAIPRRLFQSSAIVISASVLVACASLVHVSWDASENRRNSFPEADEEALEQIRVPLRIDAHLAPQDPRRFDLEHQALSKLRRVMPGVRVTYTSSTSLGLYEQAAPGYGEIWYELGGRRAMSRMTTAEGVLETIFGLAGVTPASENELGAAGHPLVARPVGAAVVFYGVWPAVVAGLGMFVFRRHV
jgi:ABC-type transport system involved in multi-copper enzyme maturation permease subunit